MWGKRKPGHEEEVPAAAGASLSLQVESVNEPLLGTQSVAGVDPKPKPNGGQTQRRRWAEAPPVPSQAGQGPTADEIKFAVTFTRVVSVLTHSPHYKHYTLSDLEWLVVPPMLSGQCAVMEAKVNGRQVPVAVALWARVSEEVDKRLSANLTTPYRLRPDEWRSGEILWFIDGVGDVRAIPQLLKQLQETIFKDHDVKMRTLGADCRPVVSTLAKAHTRTLSQQPEKADE